ncbi:TRAP transporter substrate-binding protein [Paracoccaceae bacterium GXU_MW_L88]
MKRLYASLLAALATPAVAADWNMATPYPDATFHTQNIREFAEAVAEQTDGALNITVHSGGSLFEHSDIKPSVRDGLAEAGEFFMSTASNDNAVYGVDSWPFLATTFEQADKLWEAQKPVVEQLLEEEGLVALYAVPWPPQGLYTKEPVETVADLEGLKFRTYNPTLDAFAQALGAAPTQVEATDIPQAFSTGRVEAMITSPTTGVNTQAWDYVGHFTNIQAWIPKNIIVANKRAFDSLDDATKETVMTLAAEAATRGAEMAQAETTEMVEQLKESGMEVHEPSEELLAGLQDAGAAVVTQFTQEPSDELTEVLNAYEAE